MIRPKGLGRGLDALLAVVARCVRPADDDRPAAA